jgi:orotidine-5'-phosphate decarboxylase
MKPASPLIVALDLSEWESMENVAHTLQGEVETVKVGLEAYSALGPRVIDFLKGLGFQVFVDLKLHDIPRTVGRAVGALVERGADLLTLHCLGGSAMLRAAREARDAATGGGGTLLLGVTILTSLGAGDLEEIGLPAGVEDEVLRLGGIAARAGLDGVVASARELTGLRGLLGKGAVIVVPGIRPAGEAAGDQVRVETPATALARGATYIVMGRPILEAADPALKAREVLAGIIG